MKTIEKKHGVKNVTKQDVNAANKGVAKANNVLKKAIKQERKTLNGAIAYIASSDSEQCVILREFLGLPEGANKQARRQLASKLIATAPYVALATYIDAEGNTTNGDNIPVRKNNKTYNDYLDFLTDYKTAHERNNNARGEFAKYLVKVRATCRDKDNYTSDVIDVALNYTAAHAPQKIRPLHLDPVTIAKQ